MNIIDPVLINWFRFLFLNSLFDRYRVESIVTFWSILFEKSIFHVIIFAFFNSILTKRLRFLFSGIIVSTGLRYSSLGFLNWLFLWKFRYWLIIYLRKMAYWSFIRRILSIKSLWRYFNCVHKDTKLNLIFLILNKISVTLGKKEQIF